MRMLPTDREPTPPGEMLREEFMKPLGISINGLALEVHVPEWGWCFGRAPRHSRRDQQMRHFFASLRLGVRTFFFVPVAIRVMPSSSRQSLAKPERRKEDLGIDGTPQRDRLSRALCVSAEAY